MYCYSPCPHPCSRPPWTRAFARDSWTPTGKSPMGSLFLSPGFLCTRFCCALQESISQSCVSSGSSIVGWMATSFKRVYAIPTPRVPIPAADHCWPVPHRRCWNTILSQSLWGPWVLVRTRFVWALWASLAGMGFDSECEFAPPTILLGLLLCPWMWGISSQLLQCLPSYWGFSELGRGVSPHSQSSEAQPWLLTLDMEYLFTAALAKRRSLFWPWTRGISSQPLESEKVGLKLNIQKTKIKASGPINSWQIDGETVADFILGHAKITADGDCSHEIKRHLLLERKVMTNLDRILKSRDITLLAKVI